MTLDDLTKKLLETDAKIAALQTEREDLRVKILGIMSALNLKSFANDDARITISSTTRHGALSIDAVKKAGIDISDCYDWVINPDKVQAKIPSDRLAEFISSTTTESMRVTKLDKKAKNE